MTLDVIRPVLILRPEPGASATADRAAAMGLATIVQPLFEIRPVDWVAPDAAMFDAVLLTSANALRFGGPALNDYRHLRTYAVGRATADAARAAGFSDVVGGTADVAELIAVMAVAGCRNVLHLAGHDRTPVNAPSLSVEAITVYASETLPVPDIPDDAVALLHSARAARRFAATTVTKACIAIVAISAAVADAAGSGWQSVAVAEAPQDAPMLALAASLCKTQAE